ncbi:MAG: UDP-3-O-(3-hydroxymyristoyl)glucosamine N-acyltransferase [Deltaproteobacteria bacterium]|nr:UDP-3-O-(3-hydroxymyristoyl)glucosamine N-acyltransferase [Deltaproteobacteria bacterium]
MTVTAQEIADLVGGRVLGVPDRIVSDVAPPETAGPRDLVFATTPNALDAALEGRGGTLLVLDVSALPADRTAIVVADPRLAFARAARLLRPPQLPEPGVHASAQVDEAAHIGPDVHIGAGAVVGAATLGDGAVVGAGAVVGDGAAVGANSRLHPRVVLYPGVVLGARCEVHAGTVIGAPGFGYVPTNDGNVPFPQLGVVHIGDDVEIGANCAIDRGALGTTRIGDGTKIDNLVHVGHGVTIGAHCLVAGQSGLAGSATLGDRVLVAGQVGVDTGATVGDGVQLGSRSWVLPNQRLPEGAWLGDPVSPLKDARRRFAAVRRLPELVRRVRELTRRVSELEDSREE